MRTSTIESGLKAAESRITADLMNAFLTERFFRLDEELLRPLGCAGADSAVIRRRWRIW